MAAEATRLLRKSKTSTLIVICALVLAGVSLLPWQPWTPTQAHQIADDINSGNLDRVRVAIGTPTGQQLDAGVVAQLADLHIMVDAGSFTVAQQGLATASGTVQHAGARIRVTFYFAEIDGRWVLVDALQAK